MVSRTVGYRGGISPDSSSDVVPWAQDVAIARGECVAEAFFHMAAIRTLQRTLVRGSQAPVVCRAATVQDKGATQGSQAAHLLPGLIEVAGLPVWTLADAQRHPASLQSRIARLGLATQACFAKTNVLPAAFNRADSQAEVMATSTGIPGLKVLFEQTVGEMWHVLRADPDRPLAVDRATVFRHLHTWFQRIGETYNKASDIKLGRAVAAKAARTEERRTDEALILAVYADSFLVASPERFVYRNASHVLGLYPSL